MNKTKIFKILPILLLLFACNLPNEASPTGMPAPPSSMPGVSTPEINPTEAIYYVAIVNGEIISEDLFLANKTQFDEALENGELKLLEGQVAKDIVLEDIIYRLLLSQAARQTEFFAADEMISERIGILADNLGGEEALNVWILENGYSSESFHEAIGLEIEAGWQRNQIINAVPTVAEQVLARQLFFYSYTKAEAAFSLLKNGYKFENVVEDYDPENSGYLGWFPRGYLLLPEIENLAFSLQLGEYSEIVETDFGYHIVELIDYDSAKILTTDALFSLQENALQSWLKDQWAQSQIEIFMP